MKKRSISMLLVCAMLVSLLPQTVLAVEKEDEEPRTLSIIIDDVLVVENGEVTGDMPAGVSYNEGRKTLTLDDADLGFLHIRYPGEVAVVLKGDSTIGHSGNFALEDGEEVEPFMIGGDTEVTIKGPGSLTVDASGLTYARGFVADYSDVTITDGAEVTVYGNSPDDSAKEAISIVGSNFTVEDANLTSVGVITVKNGRSVSFIDCVVHATRMMTVSNTATASSVTVGPGAVLNLTAPETDNTDIARWMWLTAAGF